MAVKKSVPLPKLLKKTQEVFNRYIRQRDSDGVTFTCISCGQVRFVDQMDAGHYVPQKGGSSVRFDEWNVNGECKKCNGFDSFHLIGYRKNLIEKIGLKAVEELEGKRNDVKKWTRSELEEIINRYK